MTPNETIDIDGILEKRGILKSATAAGWFAVEGGWKYPVHNAAGQQYQKDSGPVYRWKRHGPESPRYLWKPGKPERVRYYLLPGAVQAIKDAGFIYLASGEPDALSFYEAGKKNTLCWFDGEGSVPPSLAEDMAALDVSLLYYYPDRDEQGLQAASKLQAMLSDTDIELVIYELPAKLGSKYDINQLWTDCCHEPEEFGAKLVSLPRVSDTDLYLYGEVANDAPALASGGSTPLDVHDLHREWIGQIISALGPPAKKEGKHHRWQCPLPSHEDKNPSFRISTDKAPNFPWPMCSCGLHNESDAWAVLASALNVDSWHEFKARKRTQGYTLPPKADPPIKSSQTQDKTTLIVDSFTSLTHLEEELLDERVPDVNPIVFPFKRLHRFGGAAEIFMPRKIIFILGVSGGGKTFFSEQLEAVLRQQGQDSVWWGPEWSHLEMQVRAMQRAGGLAMTSFLKDQLWRIDKNNGVELGKRRGAKAGSASIQHSLGIIRAMKKWNGRCHYVDDPGLKPCELIEQMYNRVVALREAGRKVTTIWIDYIQLWDNSVGDSSMGVENSIKLIKRQLAEPLDLAPFIVLQPRKGDSRETRDGEELHEAAAQFVSDQKCQLYISLTPKFDAEGNKLDKGVMGVLKNSTGTQGKIEVPVNWPRLFWEDEQTKPQGPPPKLELP